MQVKYLSALKTKYASFGLSKEALDRVASQRVKTIANEDEIDADIASTETALLVMKEMQGATDALRASNAKTQKELEDLKKRQQPSANTVPETGEEETSKQIKALTEMVTAMKADLDAGKKKAQDEAVIAKVHEMMKANGCANDFIRNVTLKGIEVGENDTVDSLAEKYKSIYDKNYKDAYGEGYVPPKGGVPNGNEIDFSAMVAGLQASGDLPK